MKKYQIRRIEVRQLKFRAWDKVKKEWIYSDTFSAMWLYFKELELRGIRHFESYQYTGFKDKNEVEIYGGDLVMLYEYPWSRIKHPEVVKWLDYACGFEPFCISIPDYGHPVAGEWAEVIGNIYENKELLK